MCSSHTANHNSSTSLFAVTTKIDLKLLNDKNKNRNTIKSTVTWINRFETWQKLVELIMNWRIYQRKNWTTDCLGGKVSRGPYKPFFGSVRKSHVDRLALLIDSSFTQVSAV